MKIDKNKLTLRKATKLDIDLIIDHRIIFLNEAQGVQTNEKEANLRQSLRSYFEKALENDTFVSWLAEYEGKSIGFSGMAIHEQPGNYKIQSGKVAYILNMFTIKEFRKNGIGSLLFQKLIDEAKQRNMDIVELHATNDGEPVYRKFGFIEPDMLAMELELK